MERLHRLRGAAVPFYRNLHTAEYAQLLGKELNLPVHSLQQAKNKVPAGSEIIYLGWIMAGGIKGYNEAAKLYKVRAICGIGMGQTVTQLRYDGKWRKTSIFTEFECSY